MSKLISCSAAVVLAVALSPAFAEQPPPVVQTIAAAPDPATLPIVPPNCVQPPAMPPSAKTQKSQKLRSQWAKDVPEYRKCMEAYWNDLNDRAKAYQAVAIRLNQEYLKIVKGFNDYIDEVKKNEDAEAKDD